MGYWSIYFLIKLGLFYRDFINFHWLANLAFAIALLIPLASAKLQIARKIIALPVAISLFYYDSWLPPISRVFSQAGNLSKFDSHYLHELLGRFINLWALASFILLLTGFLLLRHRLRFATLAILGILSVPLISQLSSAKSYFSSGTQTAQVDMSSQAKLDPAAQLKAFFTAERGKHVSFPSIANSTAPFDVVFLHVCSLSWDDMEYVGEGSAPLLNRFDVVFRHFNSAASYSGPATLRLFHSNCGQLPHKQLYDNGSQRCNLFHNFELAGFDVHGLLNHDGHFDQFSAMVQGQSGISAKLEDNHFAPIAMHSFDDTPIYDDLALLTKWWSQQQAHTKPLALYYNTITLHDGNRTPNLESRSSLDTFKPRLDKLMSDFDQFISFLQSQGKPIVVVLVPEHGAALRGDKMQISGMREIPNPKITQVPMAIKLIGFKGKFGNTEQKPLQVDKPMSYLALSTLLGDFIADSPFAENGGRPLAERVQILPTTPFVSENEDIVVMARGKEYQMGSQDGTWVDYQPKPQ
jgi:cellulose synthase operon protein YhjU